ncbi:MAG: polysaccharide deacetylase family protein [Candidatus Muiribacteriaceae bacterium]
MIKISIPDNNIHERKYIIEILLREYLGLEYDLQTRKSQDYVITLPNNNRFVIKDSFFSRFPEQRQYLNIKNLPDKVIKMQNRFTGIDGIISLYGENSLSEDGERVKCDCDLFATCFFMLTRWEEYVISERDSHQRFPEHLSASVKYSFYDRPVVDEIASFIWTILEYLGLDQNRRKKQSRIIPTHDVDDTLLFKNMKSGLGIAYRQFGNGQFKNGFRTLYNKVLVHAGKKRDPFDTFDFFMQKSENMGAKSYFFFMAGGSSVYDGNYSLSEPFIRKLLNRIAERGHIIGFHPSYDSFENSDLFAREKHLLKDNTKSDIYCGRQHYLRFNVPETWRIWEENSMCWDSSMGFYDRIGFRCGTCNEYSVYDIIRQKKLVLKERPLIIMDGALQNSREFPDVETAMHKIEDVAEAVRQNSGLMTFLWHNRSFETDFWK